MNNTQIKQDEITELAVAHDDIVEAANILRYVWERYTTKPYGREAYSIWTLTIELKIDMERRLAELRKLRT